LSGVEAEVLAWLGAQAERRIDTACARVFLAGDIAWKVKRPVNPGYGDFSTLNCPKRWGGPSRGCTPPRRRGRTADCRR
jgi:aminoglycoside phosphotransferase family enzyme